MSIKSIITLKNNTIMMFFTISIKIFSFEIWIFFNQNLITIFD